jgi:hypothetical protein
MDTVPCAWCRTSNDISARFCEKCPHEVGKPRTHCHCPDCRRQGYPALKPLQKKPRARRADFEDDLS